MKSKGHFIFDSFRLKIGLWAIAISFVGFYLILSYHNRLASDDIYVLNTISEDGWIQSVFNFKFNKRLTSHLLFNLIFVWNTDLRSLHIQLFIFHLITITGFILATKYLIQQVFDEVIQFFIAGTDALLLSILSISALFFFTFQLNEVWFWTISSVIHLIPFIFLFLGMGAILQNQWRFSQFVLIFFCFFFIGGSSETIALSTIVLIGLVGLGVYFLGWLSDHRSLILKLSTALIAVLILFLYNLFGSGTGNRIELESAQYSSNYISSFAELLSTFLEFKNLVFLQFLLLCFLIGNLFRFRGFILTITSKAKFILAGIAIVALAAFTTFIPLYFVFDSLGPLRAWTPFGITLSIVLLSYAFAIGNMVNLRIASFFILIASIGITASITFYIFRQEPVVRNYSKAYDSRTEYLLELNAEGQTEPFAVLPLPSSGMLIRSVLEDEVHYGWHNECLQKALNLNFEIHAHHQHLSRYPDSLIYTP